MIKRAAQSAILPCLGILAAGCATPTEPISPVEAAPGVSTTLTPFGSEAAFIAFVSAWQDRGDPGDWIWESQRQAREAAQIAKAQDTGEPNCDDINDDQDENACEESDLIVVTGSRIQDSMTNNQVGNVDEGGIVKQIGNRVIVLRDGRLFVLDIGDANDAPRLQSRLDLYSSPREGVWFDELLVSDNRIIVTGYSYQHDASSYSILEMSEDGRVELLDRLFLSSGDYFDGTSFATRIVEGSLIFETLVPLSRVDLGDLAPPEFFRIDQSGDRQVVDSHLFNPAQILRPVADEGYPAV